VAVQNVVVSLGVMQKEWYGSGIRLETNDTRDKGPLLDGVAAQNACQHSGGGAGVAISSNTGWASS